MGFLKEGVLQVYGEGVINSDVNIKEAAQRAALLNSSGNLNNIISGPNVLYSSCFDGNDKVSIVIPSAPYSEEAVMIIAATADSLKREAIKTDMIYDYPTNVQTEYWRLILATMIATEKLAHEECKLNQYKILTIENSISTITSLEHRTSRTITLPHTQVMLLKMEQIAPGFVLSDSLKREQILYSRLDLMKKIADGILSKILDKKHINEFNVLKEKPYGYLIETDFDLVHVVYQAQDFQQMMVMHYLAYKSISQKLVSSLSERNQQQIITQPSFRLLMYFNNQMKLCIIISPETLSHDGPLEAIGIKLDRSQKYNRRYNDQKLSDYRIRLISQISQEITN